MTESDSSQASTPLSEETLQYLLNELNETSNGLMNPSNDQLLENNLPLPDEKSTMQFPGELSSQIQVPGPYPTRIYLPAESAWSAEYAFNVFIESRDTPLEDVVFTYSDTFKKLYVQKGAACPFNFFTNMPVVKDVFIRATAVYSLPKHASEIVHRCLNHSIIDREKGMVEAEHFIRCESAQSSYTIDTRNMRQSVCVPYENSPVGQDFSTYLYKFLCWNSCSGGPNRRPITLIFTLEQGNDVMGRCCFELKVCACPGRDRRNEETQFRGEAVSQEPKLPKLVPIKAKPSSKTSQAVLSEKNVDTTMKMGKKPRNHTIKVESERMYKFLSQMKMIFKMRRMVSKMPNQSSCNMFLSSGTSCSSSDE